MHLPFSIVSFWCTPRLLFLLRPKRYAKEIELVKRRLGKQDKKEREKESCARRVEPRAPVCRLYSALYYVFLLSSRRCTKERHASTEVSTSERWASASCNSKQPTCTTVSRLSFFRSIFTSFFPMMTNTTRRPVLLRLRLNCRPPSPVLSSSTLPLSYAKPTFINRRSRAFFLIRTGPVFRFFYRTQSFFSFF